ncbi:MAG TPA: hypothetical protein VJ205_00620 [Gammaproteobacteria bacterium]|nr:hypothetical protein [Gammaproteobacteria bacterium]
MTEWFFTELLNSKWFEYTTTIVFLYKNHQAKLIEIGGMADHVHFRGVVWMDIFTPHFDEAIQS